MLTVLVMVRLAMPVEAEDIYGSQPLLSHLFPKSWWISLMRKVLDLRGGLFSLACC